MPAKESLRNLMAGFTPELTEDSQRYNIVDFDGIDDYMLLPPISNVQGLSAWLFMSSTQPQDSIYFTDIRYGTVDGYFSNSAQGSIWANLYIDAATQRISWNSLPVDTWAHVHLETVTRFEDNINFMSRTASGDTDYPPYGCLKGSLATVYLWDRQLSQSEINQIVFTTYFEYIPGGGLLAFYAMEEGEGPKLYEALFAWEYAELFNGGTWALGGPAAGTWMPVFIVPSPPPSPSPPLPPLPPPPASPLFTFSPPLPPPPLLHRPPMPPAPPPSTTTLSASSIAPTALHPLPPAPSTTTPLSASSIASTPRLRPPPFSSPRAVTSPTLPPTSASKSEAHPFILDGRHGNEFSHFSDSGAGSNWKWLWVDGVQEPPVWDSIPKTVWVHVHVQGLEPFNDDLNVMSQAASGGEVSGGNCRGYVAEVYVWGRNLVFFEIETIALGFDYILYLNELYANLWAVFPFQEGEGIKTNDVFGGHGMAYLVNGAYWTDDVPPESGWHPESIVPSPPPPPSPPEPTTPPPPSPTPTPPSPPPPTPISPAPASHRPLRLPSHRPLRKWSAEFDGIDDYLQLPYVRNIKSITLWVLKYSVQWTLYQYLVDGRFGIGGGVYCSGPDGTSWQRLYIDGVQKPDEWYSFPNDTWTHVHLESYHPFDDDLTVMMRASDVPPMIGNLHGRLADIATWDRHLYPHEVRRLSQSELYMDAGCANPAEGTNLNGGRWHSYPGSTCVAYGINSHFSLEEGDYGEGVTSVKDETMRHGDAELVNGPLWVRDSPRDRGQGWYKFPFLQSPSTTTEPTAAAPSLPSPAPPQARRHSRRSQVPPAPPFLPESPRPRGLRAFTSTQPPTTSPLFPPPYPPPPYQPSSPRWVLPSPSPSSASSTASRSPDPSWPVDIDAPRSSFRQRFTSKPAPPLAPSPPFLDIAGYGAVVTMKVRFAEADPENLPEAFGSEYCAVVAASAGNSVEDTAIFAVEAGSAVVESQTRFLEHYAAEAFVDTMTCCLAAQFEALDPNNFFEPLGVPELITIRISYLTETSGFERDSADDSNPLETAWFWLMVVGAFMVFAGGAWFIIFRGYAIRQQFIQGKLDESPMTSPVKVAPMPITYYGEENSAQDGLLSITDNSDRTTAWSGASV
ncbi:hypothetical protein CYMTET_51927 [Cymbomonas tetramitiformis]|uniref:Uncharacterized protein n=1 Tax=Cymbomonas tetramitiformis TaxID=36881 RepID=A0AAE0BL78_9CHLO|nr:hypothetical protein CYMTET_51927 [Cymbomonas tetramitiformis]